MNSHVQKRQRKTQSHHLDGGVQLISAQKSQVTLHINLLIYNSVMPSPDRASLLLQRLGRADAHVTEGLEGDGDECDQQHDCQCPCVDEN